jgi:hypothetical protein
MMAFLFIIAWPIAERYDRRHDEFDSDSACGTCGGHRLRLVDQLLDADEV